MSGAHSAAAGQKTSSSAPTRLGETLGAEASREIDSLLGKELGASRVEFEALETAVRRIVLQLGANLISAKLNATGRDDQGLALRCRCGSLAHYCGRRTKRFICSLGELNLTRGYFHCAVCRRGFFPQDHRLGQTERSLFPGVVRMIGQSAARVSFAESRQLLWELAQVAVSVKQVERTAESLGRQIAPMSRR